MARFFCLILLLLSYSVANAGYYQPTYYYWDGSFKAQTYSPVAANVCAFFAANGYDPRSLTGTPPRRLYCSNNTNQRTVSAEATCTGDDLFIEETPEYPFGRCYNDEPESTCTNGSTDKEGNSANTGASAPASVCMGGCEYKTQGAIQASAGGWLSMIGKGTGQSCSMTPPTEPPNPCPECECNKAGKSYGTVNGVPSCVPRSSTGSQPVTVPNQPTTETNTPAPTEENPNPEPETTTSGGGSTTFNSDGTVTQTHNNPDGSTGSITQPLSQYCKTYSHKVECGGKVGDNGVESSKFCDENPDFRLCKQTSFTPQCNPDGTVVVSCDGDAIDCANARQHLQTYCSLTQKDETFTEEFEAMKDDDGSDNPASAENRQEVNLPSSLSETSNFSASCFSDVSINFNGATISIPISDWCPYLEALGYLFLALSYITAARIIGSGV